MSTRPVDARFVLAMDGGLQHGRDKGRTGWDTRWAETTFEGDVFDGLKNKFYEEVTELFNALVDNNLEQAASECPDVAILAMMIWDFIHTQQERDLYESRNSGA